MPNVNPIVFKRSCLFLCNPFTVSITPRYCALVNTLLIRLGPRSPNDQQWQSLLAWHGDGCRISETCIHMWCGRSSTYKADIYKNTTWFERCWSQRQWRTQWECQSSLFHNYCSSLWKLPRNATPLFDLTQNKNMTIFYFKLKEQFNNYCSCRCWLPL